MRAANGVVLVTTKRGSRGGRNTIIGTERGFQSFDWTDFILEENSPLIQANVGSVLL